MADELSRTFLGSGPAGYGVSSVMGAVLTAWDPATYANTVTDGAYTFTDCLVLNPSMLVTGRVLLLFTAGGPVILGNSYQKPPAVVAPDAPSGGSGTGNPGGGTASGTGGTGGSLTDRLDVSYTNGAGTTSTAHVYAGGLDWTKPVGVLVYADGSGEFGLANPDDTYLLAGSSGLVAVAKAHNMVLVTPRAPGNGCTDGDGVCWYLPSFDGTSVSTKLLWTDDFIKTQVLQQYNIDTTRAVIAGYSSGAEFTMGEYGPTYAASWMQDGLLLAISFGSSPAQFGITPTYTASFKQNVAAVWDIGDADTTGAQTDGTEGYNWYQTNGFATTEYNLAAGVTHNRGGQFGGIVDREVTQHVRAA